MCVSCNRDPQLHQLDPGIQSFGHVAFLSPHEPPTPSSPGLPCFLYSLGIYPCHLWSHLNIKQPQEQTQWNNIIKWKIKQQHTWSFAFRANSVHLLDHARAYLPCDCSHSSTTTTMASSWRPTLWSFPEGTTDRERWDPYRWFQKQRQ